MASGYAILDVGDTLHVDFIRVEYDVNAAMAAIRKSELPPFFAEYLEAGGKL